MDMFTHKGWTNCTTKMDVRDPQNGHLIDTVPRASREDMNEAVEAAHLAFQNGRKIPARVRADILTRVADLVLARRTEFAATIAREGIKTITEAQKEVGRCVQTLRLSAEQAGRMTGETLRFDQSAGGEQRQGYYKREPLGVIAAITPFNDPLNLVAHKVGPAIASGNAVIVKPHEATPLSALLLARSFEEAGLLPGLLQVITGQGDEAGDALVRHPLVAMISFTGGLATGTHIHQGAGLKKMAMELGGNAPVIILPDAPMDDAVASCVSGAFWAAGQNCLHVQRILIHQSVYSDFRDAFVAAAGLVRTGDKMDPATQMGPMIHEDAAGRVAAMVEDAQQRGARILLGGTPKGTHFPPTVLEQVPADCALARDEIFGPVTVLFPFESEKEAVALANQTDYGLHAGIFTNNLRAAFQLADELDCGGVMINDSSDYRIDAMPFGGFKASGLGREGVAHAAIAMTETKTFCFNF